MKKYFSKTFIFMFVVSCLFLQSGYSTVTFQNKTQMTACIEFSSEIIKIDPLKEIIFSALNNNNFKINFIKDTEHLMDFQFSACNLNEDTLYLIMLGITQNDPTEEQIATFTCLLLDTKTYKRIYGTLLKNYNPSNLLSKKQSLEKKNEKYDE